MRKICFTLLMILPIMLTGCWDQRLLVNRTLVNGVSYDLTEDGKITAAVRALHIQSKGGGLFEIQDELVGAKRPTIVGLGLDLDSTIPGELDASKAHVIIIGEDLAKKGIHPFMEFYYRNRDSYLSSKIVIGKGTGKEILSVEKEKSPIAFAILQLLESAESDTVIPKKNTFIVWNNILDPGKDMLLPYLERTAADKVDVAGVALFNGDKYTGKSISKDKSGLLLSLMNQLSKNNRMALIIGSEKNGRSISFSTRDISRNLEVQVTQDEKITCKIDLKMNIEVISYPQDFKNEINIKKINQDLSEEFTKKAKEITDTLLKANCDAFGIGRQISSYHPELWNKINWDQEYKNVQIEPVVKVNIIKTGNVF
ncbi:Ger(x)C family spore germination protein [Neobacillus niacini]|uniref:Ger(x)C family spore germination protein n=1 Tax=Neobacillus niacini TaxID=86668 RepID=UPI003B02A1E9